MEKRIRSHKRTAPGTHLVQFRANTEGIKSFIPNDLSSFEYTLACSFCGKVINDVKINSEQTTTEGSEKKLIIQSHALIVKKNLHSHILKIIQRMFIMITQYGIIYFLLIALDVGLILFNAMLGK